MISAYDQSEEKIEEAIIRQSRESFQRLPTLEMIIDRLVLALAPEIKSYCNITPEIELTALDYMTYEDVMDSTITPSLIAIAKADPWNSQIACVIEPDLLFTTLEIMLGGRRTARTEWKPRSFTAIEQKIGQHLAELCLTSLSGCFAEVSPVSFATQTLESNPKSVIMTPPATATLRVRLQLTIDDRDGHMTLVFPYGALEEVGARLAQPFLGGRLGGDSGWRTEINSQISGTNVTVTALLQELSIPLRKVLDWSLGDVIDLGITMETPVVGLLNQQPMFQATLGQRNNGSLALRVTQTLLPEEKEVEDASGID